MSDICTWPHCGHTAKDQCRTEWVLRSKGHISARAADANAITTLRAKNGKLRAALAALVEQDLLYHGNVIHIVCASHGDAIGRVANARAALAQGGDK